MNSAYPPSTAGATSRKGIAIATGIGRQIRCALTGLRPGEELQALTAWSLTAKYLLGGGIDIRIFVVVIVTEVQTVAVTDHHSV